MTCLEQKFNDDVTDFPSLETYCSIAFKIDLQEL